MTQCDQWWERIRNTRTSEESERVAIHSLKGINILTILRETTKGEIGSRLSWLAINYLCTRQNGLDVTWRVKVWEKERREKTKCVFVLTPKTGLNEEKWAPVERGATKETRKDERPDTHQIRKNEGKLLNAYPGRVKLLFARVSVCMWDVNDETWRHFIYPGNFECMSKSFFRLFSWLALEAIQRIRYLNSYFVKYTIKTLDFIQSG